MKNSLFVVLAVLAIGCSGTDTVASNQGTKEQEPTEQSQTGLEQSNEQVSPETMATPDGGTPSAPPKTGDTKTTTETKPVVGDAAENPAITESTLAGDYDGKLEFSKEAIEMLKSLAPPDKRDSVEEDIASAVIKLELKKDGSYTFNVQSKMGAENQSGKWTYDAKAGMVALGMGELTDEQRAKLKARGMTDAQIEQNQSRKLEFAVSEDGKVLKSSQMQMGMSVGMTLTRKN